MLLSLSAHQTDTTLDRPEEEEEEEQEQEATCSPEGSTVGFAFFFGVSTGAFAPAQ